MVNFIKGVGKSHVEPPKPCGAPTSEYNAYRKDNYDRSQHARGEGKKTYSMPKTGLVPAGDSPDVRPKNKMPQKYQ